MRAELARVRRRAAGAARSLRRRRIPPAGGARWQDGGGGHRREQPHRLRLDSQQARAERYRVFVGAQSFRELRPERIGRGPPAVLKTEGGLQDLPARLVDPLQNVGGLLQAAAHGALRRRHRRPRKHLHRVLGLGALDGHEQFVDSHCCSAPIRPFDGEAKGRQQVAQPRRQRRRSVSPGCGVFAQCLHGLRHVGRAPQLGQSQSENAGCPLPGRGPHFRGRQRDLVQFEVVGERFD